MSNRGRKKGDPNWRSRGKAAKSLTDKAVQKMSTATPKIVSVAGTVGLYLQITNTKRKVWKYRGKLRDQNVTRTLTLGDYPSLSLGHAQAVAGAAKLMISNGDDPAKSTEWWPESAPKPTGVKWWKDAIRLSEREAAREVPTVETFVTQFVEYRKAEGIKGWHAEELILNNWLVPDIGHVSLDEVTKRDILQIRNKAKKKGLTRQPGKIVAVASIFFGTAEDEFGLIEGNPCVRMKREQPPPKQRVMTEVEMRKWWEQTGKAIDADDPEMLVSVALALRVLLLTGQRPGEVAGMTRDELHLDAPEGPYWKMPPKRRIKGRSKRGMAHAVALTPEAVNTIEKALKLSDSEYVFERPKGGPVYDGLGRAVAQIYAEADDRPTPHAARRTVATELAKMGIDEFRISRVTGHAFKGVTGTVYINHGQTVVAEDVLNGQRHLLNMWAGRLAEIIKGEGQEDNVVAMETRA